MNDGEQVSAEVRELVPPDTGLATPALRALRPRFGDDEDLVRWIDDLMRPEGYRIIGAFDPQWSHAAAVAGFRVEHSTAWGRHLYVDDLVTLHVARKRGHALALLQWLAEEGRRLGCEELHLDSSTGPDRYDAHRLYMAAGLSITAHHFARRLDGGRANPAGA
jgi:GNAT superfamily N-acetyltransferase